MFYCNQREQTLTMNIQTWTWKSEHKHRLCTFTVCFQCNTHKYLLLFHRVNIQLTVTPRQRDSNRGDKTLKKKKVQRTEKVDDKEKLQLDTVCFNILQSELVLDTDTFPVEWQIVKMK